MNRMADDLKEEQELMAIKANIDWGDEPCSDEIVENVVKKFRNRSDVGLKKYSITLKMNNKDNYLLHLQQELQDGTLYLEKLLHQNREITFLVNSEENDTALGAKVREMIK